MPTTDIHTQRSTSGIGNAWDFFDRQRVIIQQLTADASTLDRLSAAISDLESCDRGAPVLLRQYAKLGARALAFHVDRHFGNALDCLIVVDLREADPATLRQSLPPELRRSNVFSS